MDQVKPKTETKETKKKSNTFRRVLAAVGMTAAAGVLANQSDAPETRPTPVVRLDTYAPTTTEAETPADEITIETTEESIPEAEAAPTTEMTAVAVELPALVAPNGDGSDKVTSPDETPATILPNDDGSDTVTREQTQTSLAPNQDGSDSSSQG